MTLLKLRVNDETFDRLLETAASERRPVDLQAEWLLMQSLGLVGGGADDLRAAVIDLTARRRPERVGDE